MSVIDWLSAVPTLARFALVIAAVLLCGHYLGRPAIRALLQRWGVSEALQDATEDSFSVVLVFVAAIVALTVTKIDAMPTTSGAVLAAATLSAGIGARELLRNLISGLFVVNNEDIDIGSWIEWDGHTGVVKAISLRVTRIETFDDEVIIIPNSKLTDDAIVAPASNGGFRISYRFSIGYESDIDEAIGYILEEARRIEGVTDDPEPKALVAELGSSTVQLDARVWISGDVNHRKAQRVRSDLIKRVKSRFQEEEIPMAAP